MAFRQEKLHRLGRTGERIVKNLFGGCKTTHKAPFDIVDFNAGVAYEVKTMSAMSKDLKVHISDASMQRKIAFANEYGLLMVLMVVIIHGPKKVDVYTGELRQSVRINQLTLVKGE